MYKCAVLVLYISVTYIFAAESKYIGGYYLPGLPKIDKLDANLLTHLYYAFVRLNDDGSFTLQPKDTNYIQQLCLLKNTNPDLKLLFSIQTKNGSFPKVAADRKLRKNMAENLHLLLEKFDFNGIDLDWEFPGKNDSENFISLLKEISERLKPRGYLLTAAVGAISSKGYNEKEMIKYLDIFNIMTYDYYGPWSNTTGHNSPLYASSRDSSYEKKFLNIEATIKNYIKLGVPKDKMAIGLPFYGRTFSLKDPNKHSVHDPITGGGKPATLTYYQIMRRYQNLPEVWDNEQKSFYKCNGTFWLTYDNEKSIEIKAQYAVDNDLLGVFVWQIGGDDIDGKLKKKKQLLLKKINDILV